MSERIVSRREVIAALASAAALPLVSACTREAMPIQATTNDAAALALLDEVGENLVRLKPEQATTLGIDVGWDETNTLHDLLVNVHDPDGNELGEGLAAEFEAGRPPGMPAGQEQRLVMSIGSSVTFATPGPHAAVVQANGEEIGRARFYVAAGEPTGQEFGPV